MENSDSRKTVFVSNTVSVSISVTKYVMINVNDLEAPQMSNRVVTAYKSPPSTE